MVVIIDYNTGNVGSIANMLGHLGIAAEISCDPACIAKADRLILPGVGAFDRGMRNLRGQNLVRPLEDAVLGRGVPVLGICLGMQLLARSSEEGEESGLGWVAGRVKRFAFTAGSLLKVPHMGWSEIVPSRPSRLFPDPQQRPRFYFAHSFRIDCDDPATFVAGCDYGGVFCCALESGAISGVQFHPEKSHSFGMELLRRFVEGGS